MQGTHIESTPLADRRSVTDDEWQAMDKEGRKRAVLDFLAGTGLALSPQAIYRNLRLREDMPVSYDSVARRYLRELHDDGLVRRVVRKRLEDRVLIDADTGQNSRAWYIVTEKGLGVAGEG